MQNKFFNNQKGFSIVEILVSVLIVSILTLGIYSLIILSLKVTSENQHYVEATEIANERMEAVRNMPYSQVGVINGDPAGSIPQTEIVERSGTYTVHNYVSFFDDPYDGQAGSTTKPDINEVIIDYKIITIKVSWQGSYGEKSITIFSKIIPRTMEIGAGYGMLKILVNNANGTPIAGANVRIIDIASGTDFSSLTNQDGLLYRPVHACYQGYKIIASSTGYSTEETYSNAEVAQPDKINLSVSEGNVKYDSFTIDKLATLNIRTVSGDLPDNIRVNEVKNNEEKTDVSVSKDASDNLYYVWQNSIVGSSTVFMQKYNSSLAKQWTNDVKIYSGSQFQKSPDIETAGNGRTFVVWQDNSSQLKLAKNDNNIKKIAANSANQEEKNIYKKVKIFERFHNKASEMKIIINKKLFNFRISTKNFFQKTYAFLKTINSKNVKNYFSFRANAALGTVSFVGSSGGTDITHRYIDLNTPAGIQPGDFLLAYVYNDRYDRGPVQTPSGWNLLDNSLRPSCSWFEFTCNSRGAIFWKIVSTGDPAAYRFNLTSTQIEEKAGQIRAYRGVDSSDPFDGSLLDHTTTTGDHLRPAPDQTVGQDNSMLVCGWGSDDPKLTNGSLVFPSGMVNGFSNYNTNVGQAIADKPVNISSTGIQNYDANRSLDQKSIDWSLVLKPSVLPDNIMVGTGDNQLTSLMIPSVNQYLGGKFIFTANAPGNHIVNSITVKEEGTVNAGSSLLNLKLFYDLDTSAPYDCADEQYDGSEIQFGTDSAFDASNNATFINLPGIEVNGTKTLCAYIVLDVDSDAVRNDTIEISIDNPSTDVVLASGTVIPNSTVSLSGTTNLLKPAGIQQIHYRWRNDDDDQVNASWIAAQDSAVTTLRNQNVRLRLEVKNDGDFTTNNYIYSLEYAEKSSSDCSTINQSQWHPITTNPSDNWVLADSSFLTDAGATINSSGVTDENSVFKEGELKEVNNTTAPQSLQTTEFSEFEYSIQATNNSTDASFCFRLTNSGSTDTFTYSAYPIISIIGDENIYISAFNSDGSLLWNERKVNSDGNLSNAQQTNPVIALTEKLGSATTVIAWEDDRNANGDIYMQSFDRTGNKIWTLGDILVAGTGDTESSPSIAINSLDQIIILWTSASTSHKTEIYANKFDLDGTSLWGSSKKIISSATSDELNPKVAIDQGSNNAFVAWTEDDGVSKKAKITSFDSDFNEFAGWQQTANVQSFDKDKYDPNLAYGNGYLYVSWTDLRENNEDIYAQKYTPSGGPQWANDVRININADNSLQNKSILIVNSLGEPFCAWSDYRNLGSNIYSTKFNDPSSLVNSPNVPLKIYGSKTIGKDASNVSIIKNNLTGTTDTNGNLSIKLEWDTAGYTITTDTALTPKNIILAEPILPISLSPDETKNIILYVE